MSGIVGQAFVEVKPIVRDFRGEVARDVNANLGRGGAVPLPVQPTITPQAKQAFARDASGLRGLLLGGGQFSAARALGISSAAAGLFVVGRGALAAVKSAATLQQELDVLQQVSGATADQMKELSAEARRLGADIRLPGVSSADAAATMVELAKAGLSVDDVLKGTTGTLQLATAANIDFATSSELAADALNSFQLPGSQAAKVADLLAGAANAAQGDISDFGVGLSQVAAVAHQAGLSVGETVTFLAEFAKAGISGSDAGTSFRVALLRLIAPTTEAQKIFRALGIDLEGFQSGRVRAPEFFQQLAQSLNRLEPATRNAALATIFGQDAIRVTAVAVRDAGREYDQLAEKVGRANQAQETADARTKGLAGKVGGLSSNIETLGTDLGTIAIPALSLYTDVVSEAVTETDKAVVAVTNLVHETAGFKVGPFGSLGDAFKKAGGDALDAIPALGALRREVKAVQDLSRDSAAKSVSEAVFGAQAPGGGALANLLRPQRGGEDVRNAALAGNAIGTAFVKGTADAIEHDSPVVVAAKRAVREAQDSLRQVIAQGQDAVNAVIQQGADAVRQSAVQAKQNLQSIALGLEQSVLVVLDNGPLAKRIQKLRDELTADAAADERKRAQRELADAKAALQRAQESIAGGGQTATQRAAEAEFLKPFRERVDDARTALDHLNKEGKLDKLTANLDAQKKKIQQGLDDVVARFNAGLLSSPQTIDQAAAILQRNIGPMKAAGKAQGFAFAQEFDAQLDALRAQITEIAIGPHTGKTGKEPNVVSPAAVAKQAAADVAAARAQANEQQVRAVADVRDAVTAASKAQHADIAGGGDSVVGLLKRIHQDLNPRAPSSRKSSTVAPAAPRGTRSGGR